MAVYGRPVLYSIPAAWIAHLHTFFGLSAFVGTLVVALSLHYVSVVKNEFYGYPVEWFPSVSAAIGDWFPERNLFQLLIAVAAGPRFALVLLWFILARRRSPVLASAIAIIGVLRSFFCGGWVYITSTDSHHWHDVFMIGYLILTLPWTIGILSLTPSTEPKSIYYRKLYSGLFFGSLLPLIYYFVQHKVHRVPGAYTRYAFFEWTLVILDVLYDSVTYHEFRGVSLQIVVLNAVRGKGNDDATPYLSIRTRDTLAWFSHINREEFITFCSDCYLGFVFWTLLTSLGLTIWYFPLWFMGISGFEIVLFSTISPFLLSVRKIRHLASSNIVFIHFCSLIGLLSYALSPDPTLRLLCVGLGTALTTMAWTLEFSGNSISKEISERKAMSLAIGLISSSIAKFAFWGNNPVWPIMHNANGGMNKSGIMLACLACIWRSMSAPLQTLQQAETIRKPWNWRASIGFAGLMFGLHSFLCDSSTIILWVWDGYPITGPVAVPHGALTLMIMSAGLLLGMYCPNITTSWAWYVAATIGTFILVFNKGWIGYSGGALLAAYLMSIIPSFVESISHSPSPGKTFGFAFLVYNLFCLAHVWTVAYAFVPLGWALRERTDLVTLLMSICICIGVSSIRENKGSFGYSYGRIKVEKRLRTKQNVISVLGLLMIWTLIIAHSRLTGLTYKPYHADEKLFTAGIWTVHFGLDNDMWASEVRMRDVIRDLEIDVIGLLESDLQRIIMGFRDVTQFIAEDLGMYSDFGPGPNSHTWGAALLSKFPIIQSTHHLLPSPVGELAPAIHATLDIYGTHVDVLIAHSGQEEDAEDRHLQLTELARIMTESPRPLILLSYLVTKPLEGNYKIIENGTRMHDIEPNDWDRWCEYIWYRGVKRVGYARLHRDSITDTEIQSGKFVVVDSEEQAETTHRVTEEQVPAGYRYPSMFKGQGKSRGITLDKTDITM
ncbi:Protein cwh43 [Neolecta irregularis DAH-3]|uniref:Protein cwh43 n=1 Tax=Neolecta irregularis (strain DAH-3) TaxID=1198029 RepID=A0A1U7LNQ5_NEOID|nr:Protein cwh43 [Neolecta irregularis DAH-3]|eukprot:OLL24296.1 Protein cwh43 [Neolecta irregularis DAH-3]